ncbi:hypothetical protein PINS_up017685 [Pythium insidiosum]|nr:hypothetical protein PINS_up017685 [Pythium insidiosum]
MDTNPTASGDVATAAGSDATVAGGAVPLVTRLQLRSLHDTRAAGTRRRHSDASGVTLASGSSLVTKRPSINDDVQSVDDTASSPHLLQSRRSRTTVVAAPTTSEDASVKRYAEMMERFQVRRVARSPSSASNAGGDGDAADGAAPVSSSEPPEHAAETSRGQRPASRHSTQSRFTDLAVVKPLDGSTTATTTATTAATTTTKTTGLTAANATGGDLHETDELYYQVLTRRRLGTSLQRRLARTLAPMSPASLAFQCRLYAMLLVLVVHAVLFPLHLAFHMPRGVAANDVSTETLVDVVLIVDLVLMFNTCVEDKDGEMVTDRRAIRREYLRSWFLLDLASSVPRSLALKTSALRHNALVTGASSSELRLLFMVFDLCSRGARMFHVVQLAKLHWKQRVDRSSHSVLAWMLYSRYSHLLRIVWIVLCVVGIAHYIACGWRLLLSSPDASLSQSPVYDDYVVSLYDALQLLQGQGVEAKTAAQNVFAAFAVLVGSILLAVMFGHVAILVSNFNANTTSYQRKMESVFAVMSKLQLPVPLRERIHQYYEHLWREYESLDGEIVRFTKDLSHTLELEVVLYKYMDLVMHVPFWRECSPDFQKQLMLHLHVRVYLPDDYVMRRGEVGDEFYMINRGVCELLLGPDSFECSTQPLVDVNDDDVEDNDDDDAPIASGESLRSSHGRHNDRENLYVAMSSRSAGAVPPTPPKRRRDRMTSVYSDVVAKPHAPLTGAASASASPFVQTLTRGQAFGDIALLMNYERTANVRALSYVEMCVLKRDDFQKILVRHPNDRKLVINNILTRTLEHNEATGVWCPLKETVRSVFSETDPEHAKTISGVHAGLLIATAINAPLEDESIKFGIGGALRGQLVALRDQQTRRASRDASSRRAAKSERSKGRTQEDDGASAATTRTKEEEDGKQQTASTVNLLLDPLREQIHAVQDTQERLMRMMEAMQCELSELRRMNRHVFDLVSASTALQARSPNPCGAAAEPEKLSPPRVIRRMSRRLSRDVLLDPPETIPEGQPASASPSSPSASSIVAPAFFRRKSMSASTLSTSRTGDSLSSAPVVAHRGRVHGGGHDRSVVAAPVETPVAAGHAQPAVAAFVRDACAHTTADDGCVAAADGRRTLLRALTPSSRALGRRVSRACCRRCSR